MEDRQRSSSPNTLKRYIAELATKPVIIQRYYGVITTPTAHNSQTKPEDWQTQQIIPISLQKPFFSIICSNWPQADRIPTFLTHLLEHCVYAAFLQLSESNLLQGFGTWNFFCCCLASTHRDHPVPPVDRTRLECQNFVSINTEQELHQNRRFFRV